MGQSRRALCSSGLSIRGLTAQGLFLIGVLMSLHQIWDLEQNLESNPMSSGKALTRWIWFWGGGNILQTGTQNWKSRGPGQKILIWTITCQVRLAAWVVVFIPPTLNQPALHGGLVLKLHSTERARLGLMTIPVWRPVFQTRDWPSQKSPRIFP